MVKYILRVEDIIIIGAGLSGIITSKYLTEKGLKHVILEKRETFGGIWKYSDDENITTVTKKTIMSSSAAVSFFSDKPFPKDYPHFPHANQYYEYLKIFVKDNKIEDNIIYNVDINKISKEGDIHVIYSNDKVYKCKKLIIATGLHNIKNNIFPKNYLNYTGKVLHSQQIKFNKPYCKKTDTVMIYGGGETASDITMNTYLNSTKTIWCIPRGMWCIKRQLYGRPLDEFGSIQRTDQFPPTSSNIHNKFSQAHGKSGTDVKEFDAKVPYYHKYLVKSVEPVIKIHQGKIIPKRGIKNCSGKTFIFDDGKKVSIDCVIDCTGYTHDPVFQFKGKRVFKSCIDIDDPSVSYIGFCRPIVGSLMWVAEIQAKLVSAFLSDEFKISKEKMVQHMENDAKYYEKLFGNNIDHNRLNILDLVCEYFPSIMKLLGEPLPKHNPMGTLEEQILTKCSQNPALLNHANPNKRQQCLEICKNYCKLIHYNDHENNLFKTHKLPLDLSLNIRLDRLKFIFKNRRWERIYDKIPKLTYELLKNGISYPNNYPWAEKKELSFFNTTNSEQIIVYSTMSLFTFGYLATLPKHIKMDIGIQHISLIIISWIIFQKLYSVLKMRNIFQYIVLGCLHGFVLCGYARKYMPKIPKYFANQFGMESLTLFQATIPPMVYGLFYGIIYPILSKKSTHVLLMEK